MSISTPFSLHTSPSTARVLASSILDRNLQNSDLSPTTTPIPAQEFLVGEVGLLWPFSSSRRKFSFLLHSNVSSTHTLNSVESSRTKIILNDACAEKVAELGIGIGDEVTISYPTTNNGRVITDGDLEFGNDTGVSLQITKSEEKEKVGRIALVYGTRERESRDVEDCDNITRRESLKQEQSFTSRGMDVDVENGQRRDKNRLKRIRISEGHFLESPGLHRNINYDGDSDVLDDSSPRKRRRRTASVFIPSGQWKFAGFGVQKTIDSQEEGMGIKEVINGETEAEEVNEDSHPQEMMLLEDDTSKQSSDLTNAVINESGMETTIMTDLPSDITPGTHETEIHEIEQVESIITITHDETEAPAHITQIDEGREISGEAGNTEAIHADICTEADTTSIVTIPEPLQTYTRIAMSDLHVPDTSMTEPFLTDEAMSRIATSEVEKGQQSVDVLQSGAPDDMDVATQTNTGDLQQQQHMSLEQNIEISTPNRTLTLSMPLTPELMPISIQNLLIPSPFPATPLLPFIAKARDLHIDNQMLKINDNNTSQQQPEQPDRASTILDEIVKDAGEDATSILAEIHANAMADHEMALPIDKPDSEFEHDGDGVHSASESPGKEGMDDAEQISNVVTNDAIEEVRDDVQVDELDPTSMALTEFMDDFIGFDNGSEVEDALSEESNEGSTDSEFDTERDNYETPNNDEVHEAVDMNSITPAIDVADNYRPDSSATSSTIENTIHDKQITTMPHEEPPLPSTLPILNEHQPFGQIVEYLPTEQTSGTLLGDANIVEEDSSQDEDAAWANMDEALKDKASTSHERQQAPAVPLTSIVQPLPQEKEVIQTPRALSIVGDKDVVVEQPRAEVLGDASEDIIHRDTNVHEPHSNPDQDFTENAQPMTGQNTDQNQTLEQSTQADTATLPATLPSQNDYTENEIKSETQSEHLTLLELKQRAIRRAEATKRTSESLSRSWTSESDEIEVIDLTQVEDGSLDLPRTYEQPKSSQVVDGSPAKSIADSLYSVITVLVPDSSRPTSVAGSPLKPVQHPRLLDLAPIQASQDLASTQHHKFYRPKIRKIAEDMKPEGYLYDIDEEIMKDLKPIEEEEEDEDDREVVTLGRKQSRPIKSPETARTRLSLVPDTMDIWFNSKRSPATKLDDHRRKTIAIAPIAPDFSKVLTIVEKHAPRSSTLTKHMEVSPRQLKRFLPSSGLSTNLAYFTPLTNLDVLLNKSSTKIDVIAVATSSSSGPTRAKTGPRDWYTILRLTDPQSYLQNKDDDMKLNSSSRDVRVEVFRPWKTSLPLTSPGDVILLRSFAVKSRQRESYLLSSEESAWCVWRYGNQKDVYEHAESERPSWAHSSVSQSDSIEDIRGPPLDLGDQERERARELHAWYQLEKDVEQRGLNKRTTIGIYEFMGLQM